MPGPRRRGRERAARSIAFAGVLLLALTACGGSARLSAKPQVSSAIRVLAASSLTEVMHDLVRAFEQTHPGTRVETDFGGSPTLAAQIEQGVPADIFASADPETMQRVASFVQAPVTLASNSMAIAVEHGNPKELTGVASLAKRGVLVVLCNPAVPCGKLAQQVLRKAHSKVVPVSYEDNVKGIVTKIRAGNADAGIVYATDVLAAATELDAIPIPPAQNATTTYPIARLRESRNAALADSFIGFVRSAEGRRILGRRGFVPPA